MRDATALAPPEAPTIEVTKDKAEGLSVDVSVLGLPIRLKR